MVTLIILLIISVIILWLTIMYGIWRKDTNEQITPSVEEVLTPAYQRSTRLLRRGWFKLLRSFEYLQKKSEKIFLKIFFTVFPNAKKAFEKKDELTGLEHGPSSYFLMSVSEYKEEIQKPEKKIRRNKKNV